MDRFHPSQISWTSFPNRDPTSVSQLWPPSNRSGSGDTTPDSTLPPTTDTSLSDLPPTTASSLSPPSPQLFLDHSKSVESLRSFVKKEIGLNAIDNRLSLPVIEDARSSSWSTVDSDSFNPASWTEERVNRGGQSSRECNVPSADEVAKSEEQKTPIENLSKFKEKYLSRCNSFKVGTKAGAKAVVSKVRKCFCKLVG